MNNSFRLTANRLTEFRPQRTLYHPAIPGAVASLPTPPNQATVKSQDVTSFSFSNVKLPTLNIEKNTLVQYSAVQIDGNRNDSDWDAPIAIVIS